MAKVILMTGCSGFLGRNVHPVLQHRYSDARIVTVSSKDYDLRDPLKCVEMFRKIKPRILIHLPQK